MVGLSTTGVGPVGRPANLLPPQRQQARRALCPGTGVHRNGGIRALGIANMAWGNAITAKLDDYLSKI